jgi:hypothetical protein
MKRSKIFLGATACILGVAGFAASKAKWHALPSCYYVGTVKHADAQLGTIAGTVRLTTIVNSTSTPLYTAKCAQPIYAGGN